MTSRDAHFSPALFQFLGELRLNNERPWFEANKARYMAEVRDPMLRFVGDFAPHLRSISPHFVADPRPNGGSLFRIYRDVRFSKDKSPYKTMAAAHFRHATAKDVHAPGFYLHLEPGGCFLGTGIWHPDAPTLAKIRENIVDDPDGWTAAKTDPAFARAWQLSGESLKRPPKGYDADHPLIEDLKRKDFVSIASVEEEAVCAPDFLDRFAELCRSAAPFMRYLTRAVGASW